MTTTDLGVGAPGILRPRAPRSGDPATYAAAVRIGWRAACGALLVLPLALGACTPEGSRDAAPAGPSPSVYLSVEVLPPSEAPFVPDVQQGRVLRVLGGGRLLLRMESGQRIPVITIGALSPFATACHAEAARRMTERLAPVGSEVTVSVDRYIRHRRAKGFRVRYVDVGAVDLADRLLIAGEALFSSEVVQTDEFQRRPRYERHVRAAVRAGRGLWGDCL